MARIFYIVSYHHFTIVDRVKLKSYLDLEFSVSKIARLTKVNGSSISREINRNQINGNYEPIKAGRFYLVIANKTSDEVAKEYFEDHAKWFDEGQFERLRRITGYLVGILDRWNDAKRAEESVRVKHCVNSVINDAARLAALETQAVAHSMAYATR